MSRTILPVRLFVYLQERFPFHQFIPLALVFGAASVLSRDTGIFAYTVSALYLYLLELRLFDENKDYGHDKKFYPQRPVARGFIALSELNLVLTVNLVLQVYLAISGKANLTLFAGVQLYTFLMAKEFFVKKWLVQHFTLYILSHEVITPFLFLYLISFNHLATNLTHVLLALLLSVCLFLLEVGRKLKPREKTQRARDTYLEHYGENGVSVFVSVLVLFTFGIYLILTPLPLFSAVPALVLFITVYELYRYAIRGWEKSAQRLFGVLIAYVFSLLVTTVVYRLTV